MTKEIKPTTPANTSLSTTMPSEHQQQQNQHKQKSSEKEQDKTDKNIKKPKKGLFDEFV